MAKGGKKKEGPLFDNVQIVLDAFVVDVSVGLKGRHGDARESSIARLGIGAMRRGTGKHTL